MTRPGKRLVILGVSVLALAGTLAATTSVIGGSIRRQALKSNDLTGIRHEALTMFPRGSRLQDALIRLADIGFECAPMLRALADVSGPAVLCASNGRGYPDYPAINVTVSARNGLVSEIDVWNVIARSDEETSLAGVARTDQTPVAVATASNAPSS